MSVLHKKICNLKSELKRALDNFALYNSFSLPVRSMLAKKETLNRNINKLKAEISALEARQ